MSAEIVTQPFGPTFVQHFYLVAPTIHYKYELFQVSHGISFYPLELRQGTQKNSLADEAQFKEALKLLFSSTATLNAVHSILAQVRS